MDAEHFQIRRPAFTLVHLLLVIAILAVLLAFVLPMVARSRQSANLILCKDHLRQVGVGLLRYAHANGGRLPESPTIENPQIGLVQSLTASGDLADPRILYCPAEQKPELEFSDENLKNGDIGYFNYNANGPGDDLQLSKFLRKGAGFPRKLDAASPANSWMMSDVWFSGVPTAHAGYQKGVNYLMLDGSVGFMSTSPRQGFH